MAISRGIIVFKLILKWIVLYDYSVVCSYDEFVASYHHQPLTVTWVVFFVLFLSFPILAVAN